MVNTLVDVTTTATIRIDADLLKRAKRRRINVSQAARQGIEDAIRAREFSENSIWLAAHEVTPMRPSKAVLRQVRAEE